MSIIEPRDGDGPSAKRKSILDASRHVFAELGYERASMDQIAARAGVSKATVYNHFADKEALFFASFLDVSADLRSRVAEVFESPAGDAALDLQRVGEHFLEVLLAPDTIALHRILMAEVGRFPELGRALYEHVGCTMKHWVAGYLEQQHASGRLLVEQPELAARQFLALCQVDLVSHCQLGMSPTASGEEIAACVAHAVRTFLRAHRP